MSETLVSSHRHLSELLIPSFGKPMQRLWGSLPGSMGMVVHVCDRFAVSRQSAFECCYCEVIVVRL